MLLLHSQSLSWILKARTASPTYVDVSANGLGAGPFVFAGSVGGERFGDSYYLTINGDSGDVVSVLYVSGLCVLEFPAQNYLKLLEVQGGGVVEYFASGNQ